MLRIRSEQAEVRWVVVRRVAVNMVNHFLGFQVPSELLFHHKTMLSDSSLVVRMWMLWGVDQDVSPSVRRPAARPEVVSL
jgi:hypothetical protein